MVNILIFFFFFICRCYGQFAEFVILQISRSFWKITKMSHYTKCPNNHGHFEKLPQVWSCCYLTISIVDHFVGRPSSCFQYAKMFKHGTAVQKLQKKGTPLRFICVEDVFHALQAIHPTTGHEGRIAMCEATSEKCVNISLAKTTLFWQFHEECQIKKSSVPVLKTLK